MTKAIQQNDRHASELDSKANLRGEVVGANGWLRPTSAQKFGRAWLGLTAALAIHVTDEALTDFLSFYNPGVLAIRQRIPWLPLPTFTFGVWLAGLIGLVLILLALSRLAFRDARWMGVLAYPFGVIMLFNGLGHIGGSIYFGRWMPGVYSAPLLLAASIYLLAAARRFRAQPAH